MKKILHTCVYFGHDQNFNTKFFADVFTIKKLIVAFFEESRGRHSKSLPRPMNFFFLNKRWKAL